MQSTLTQFLLAILGGLLSWLAWSPSPFFALIFIAWLPLLFLEKNIANFDYKKKTRRLFFLSYTFFITWNALTTWWVKNASLGGAIAAIITNSLFMCVPILLFYKVKNRLGSSAGYGSLIAFWLSFEYLHQTWEITWPWLTLGNVFAEFPQLVQWYEFTGSSGGTLWVLLVNLALFFAIQNTKNNFPENNSFPETAAFLFKTLRKPLLLLAVPLLISVVIFNTYEEKGTPVDIVVLQPNINPYEKWDRKQKYAQMEKFVNLSKTKLDDTTDYLVFPETSLPQSVWLHEFEQAFPIKECRKLLENYPNLTLVSGVTSLRYYKGEKGSITARPLKSEPGNFYDVYNAAIELNAKNIEVEHYIKSKLVPGVERMPYPGLFGFLSAFAIDLGGIAGSLGSQEEREVFFNEKGIGIAPVICYESVFAEYVTEYINKGAGLIFIVTNDAWWGETPGHKQHLKYASLRAIENRRAIARSANTGVSCFITQKGIIEQATVYNTDAVIRQTILSNTKLTFFSRYGDLISRFALGFCAFFLFNLIVSRFTNSFKFASVKRKERLK